MINNKDINIRMIIQDDFFDDGAKKVYSEPQISYCKWHYVQYAGIMG